MMHTEHNTTQKRVTVSVISNNRLQGDYFLLSLNAPEIAAAAKPGQFVHIQIPMMQHRLLRRPFSIFDITTPGGELRIIYKVVGEGTRMLSSLPSNTTLDIMGPLGKGFSTLPDNALIVAGGYGSAATFMLAKYAPVKPVVLLGARTEADILLVQDFSALGCRVLVSTDDGSRGFHGRVTQLLENTAPNAAWLAACGPIPMLKALAAIMQQHGIHGELSLDNAMCCGVGACFACVTKIKAPSEPDGWKYARVCSDGPVFNADDVIFD